MFETNVIFLRLTTSIVLKQFNHVIYPRISLVKDSFQVT